MPAKTVYELVASDAESVFGWEFKSHSTEIYESREDAEADLPKFRAKCLDTTRPNYAIETPDLPLVINIRERKFISANS